MFDDPEKLDKQFVYYFFKVADWCTYRSDPKTTMMGETVTNYSLLEKLKFSKESLIIIQTTQFWGTYYRHNNHFYTYNKDLLEKVNPNRKMKGIEKKLHMLVN